MKQEIIRLDQLTMGTIKYSDITLLQEKETEIISSDSLWRGIHGYYNGLVKSNIGNGKKVILQIHSKKEFILLFMALIRTGAWRFWDRNFFIVQRSNACYAIGNYKKSKSVK